MAINVAPWVKETCTTTGTGSLVLSGKVDSFVRFNAAIEAGDEVWYAVLDSNGNRESGKGVFDGINTITRAEVSATLVEGAYSEDSPAPINLSGTSVVVCTLTAAAFEELMDSVSASLNMDNMTEGTNNKILTAEERSKLDVMEIHFRGVYPDLASLEAGVTNPVAGNYADVDQGEGFQVARYIYDASDDTWTEQGSGTSLTAEQVKTMYESNANTNAFTDALASKLADTLVFTQALLDKLNGIESGATADLTATEIAALYEGLADTNAFTDAEKNAIANLGDAATRTVQSLNTDTTAGRVLLTGAFGLGAAFTTSETDLNTGIYVVSGVSCISAAISSLSNRPSQDESTANRYVCQFYGTTDNGYQVLTNRVSGVTYTRSWNIGAPSDWVTVYDSGNSIDARTFGLGLASGDKTSIANADLNTFITSGQYFISATDSTNLPVNNNGYLEVLSSSSTSFTFQRYTLVNSLVTYERINNNGTWGAWQTTVHTASLGASAFLESYKTYGLGASMVNVADLNALDASGLYSITGANAVAGNAPSSAPHEVIHVQYDSNSAKQLAFRAGHASLEFSVRVKSEGTWYGWRTVYTSENSINAVDYGLGVVPPRISDMNGTNYNTGFFHSLGTNGDTNTPQGENIAFINLLRDNTSRRAIFAVSPSAITPRAFLRSFANAWSDWCEIHHTGNADFQTFIWTTSDLKHVIKRNDSYIQMELQVPFTPTSITTSGTVAVRRTDTGATVATGLTFRMSSQSGQGVVLIETDSTNAFAGTDLFYVLPESTLTITVNR